MSILEILGLITKPIADAYSRRQERKQIEHTNDIELLKAQGERVAKQVSEGLAADATWELEQVKQMDHSWKDELIIILLSIPLVCVFMPPLQQAVLKGFQILELTPSWYRWLVMLIFTAVYGIRIWRRNQSDT